MEGKEGHCTVVREVIVKCYECDKRSDVMCSHVLHNIVTSFYD